MAKFNYKFRQEEVIEIILRHMVIEGLITDDERKFFTQMHQSGSKVAMEFIVEELIAPPSKIDEDVG